MNNVSPPTNSSSPNTVLGSLRFAEKVTTQSQQIAALASVHRLLRTKIPADDPAQMPLF